MSQAINPVKIVKVMDSRLESAENRDYAVLMGGQMYTMRPYSATSISASSFSFTNINPPSDNIFVNKVILVKNTYDINLTAALPVGSTIMDYWGSELALRCLPFNNSLVNLNVRLNSASFSQDQNDLLPALTRINF